MKCSTVAKALAATTLVLPALTNAVLHVIDPLTADTDAGELRQAAAHPLLTQVDNLKLLLLLLIPAALLVAAVTFRRAPWSALLGCALLTVAMAANTLDLAEYQVFGAAAKHPDAFLPALQVTEDSGLSSALFLVFVFGSLVGTVLLGVALLRSRVVARWAGWAVVASGPLNIVGHFGTPRVVDVVAWLLLAVGFGAVAPRVGEWVDAAAVELSTAPMPGLAFDPV